MRSFFGISGALESDEEGEDRGWTEAMVCIDDVGVYVYIMITF